MLTSKKVIFKLFCALWPCDLACLTIGDKSILMVLITVGEKKKIKSLSGLGMAAKLSTHALLKVTCLGRVFFFFFVLFFHARFWFAILETPQWSIYWLCPYIYNTFWLRCLRALNICFKQRTVRADICYKSFQRAMWKRSNPGRATASLCDLPQWHITWPQARQLYS